MKTSAISMLALAAAIGLGSAAIAQTSSGGSGGASGTTGSTTGTVGTGGTGTTGTTTLPQPKAGENTSGSGQTTTGTSQSQNTTGSSSATPPAATTGSATTQQNNTSTAASSGSAGEQQKMQNGMLASRLIGTTVYSTSGESIGDINDIVVQPQSGQIVNAIIGVGGFLGIGEKDVAIDIAQLQVQPQEGGGTPRLVLNTTKEALNNAPSFNKSALLGEGGSGGGDTSTGSTGTSGTGSSGTGTSGTSQ